MTLGELATAIAERVPGAAVTVRRLDPVRGFLRGLAAGTTETAEFDVTVDGARLCRLRTPGTDVEPEAVAGTLRTLAAVARRFPRLRAAVKVVSFDRHDPDITGDVRWAGQAHGSLGTIHLHAGIFRRTGPEEVTMIVAHECWHQLEHDLEVRRYADVLALRRTMGAHFGVDTLEHACEGDFGRAPAAWRQAHVRLAREVSAYATTNVKEAMAELFMLWWLDLDPEPPAVTTFGQALEDLRLAQ